MNKDKGIASIHCESMDFAQMQTSFAGLGYKPADYNKVAFTPTGAWLFEENNEDFKYAGTTPGFFNVVLSAAVERLSFYVEKGTDYYTLPEAKRKSYDKALSDISAKRITKKRQSCSTPLSPRLKRNSKMLRRTKTTNTRSSATQ